MTWREETEPFPAFLTTLNGIDLARLQHDARRVGDALTLAAVLDELKKRALDNEHCCPDCPRLPNDEVDR